MIRINLLPTKAARRKESVIVQIVFAVIVIGASVGVVFWFNRSIENEIVAEQQKRNDLQAKIAQLQNVVNSVNDYKNKSRDLTNKINTIKDLNAKRSGPVKMLEEFTYVVPRKAWITTFREVEKQLTLEGVGVDGPTVADFIDELRSSKYFYDVQLIQVQQTDDGGRKMQRFNVNCRVRYVSGDGA